MFQLRLTFFTPQHKLARLVQLETLKFETDENDRNVVTVHQIVRDLQGNLLADVTIQQIFIIENSLISLYEIGEIATIQEMIQKTRIPNEQRNALSELICSEIAAAPGKVDRPS
jgi:hypothetical protein